MLYSLQSRDLIADQVETAAGGHWLDGMVVVPGCDKNMPGVLMARQYLIFSLFAKDLTAILQYSRTVESTRTNGLWWYHSGWLMCWTATIRHCFCIPVVWEVSTRWKDPRGRTGTVQHRPLCLSWSRRVRRGELKIHTFFARFLSLMLYFFEDVYGQYHG
jgi:hypothetical protein